MLYPFAIVLAVALLYAHFSAKSKRQQEVRNCSYSTCVVRSIIQHVSLYHRPSTEPQRSMAANHPLCWRTNGHLAWIGWSRYPSCGSWNFSFSIFDRQGTRCSRTFSVLEHLERWIQRISKPSCRPGLEVGAPCISPQLLSSELSFTLAL